MRDFKSGCRRQINLVRAAPYKATEEISGLNLKFMGGKRKAIRRRPYLPSFSRIPARTIDPATGASTWALGSQR